MDFTKPVNMVASLLVFVAVFGGIMFFMQRNSPSDLSQPATPQRQAEVLGTVKATIKTAKGDIKLELYSAVAPKTVDNFVTLTKNGFYNGLSFHRVISDFMIQGGDPKGDGTGGPGYQFEDEINPRSINVSESMIKENEARGYKYNYSLQSLPVDVSVIAMANAGPNSNGSQFFIVTEKAQTHLNGLHTVFGRVIEGMDVVRKIQQGDKMIAVTIE